MPIDFTCPYCGERTNVANRFAGMSGPCVGCGQTVTVPAAEERPTGMRPAPIPPQASRGSWGPVVVSTATTVVGVLICAGLLAALIFPALVSTHGPARRTMCNNNLKNLSLALQNYHDTFRTFPAGAWHSGTAGESERLGPSWYYGTLPFLEQRNVYDKIQQLQAPGAPGNGAFNAENLNGSLPGSPLSALAPDYMRCPMSPLPLMETRSGPICLPSYVGISGGCDIAADSPDFAAVSKQIMLVRPETSQIYKNRRKGMGHVPGAILTVSGMLPACEQVAMADCTDGTSNTMIVGEQSDWLLDVDRNVSTKYHGDSGWDTNGTGPVVPSTNFGGGFISGTAQAFQVPAALDGLPGKSLAPFDCYNLTTVRYPPNWKQVLGTTPYPGCSEDHGINNPLQSPHPGGMLVALVDGSVSFISDTTDLAVLLQLAIRDDGQNVRLD